MAKKLSAGNWDINLKKEGAKEIRELTQSFITMSKSLESRESMLKKGEERLEELNQELEHRILARTNELNVINENLKSQINERLQTEVNLKNKEQLLRVIK